ncbi:MAG TPA: hypothetical protein VEL73_04080 [Mycobacteriales bacterium]|nr:hypothetical protein [Mycobacteriales bacterium]
MRHGVADAVIAVSLVVGLGIIVLALLGRRPILVLLGGLAAVELAALAQVVVAVVVVLRGERPDSAPTFTGYALASLLVPPAGAVWALAERSRWGTAAAGISCLVLAVLTVRMRQVWG